MKENIPKETETIAAKRAARVAEKLKKARKGFVQQRAWWSNELLEIFGIAILVILNLLLVYQFLGKEAPSTTFSGPLIPLLAKGLTFFGPTLSYAIGIIYVVTFLIFPAGIYLFIKEVSGRKLVAYISSLMVSLTFYPFALFRINSMFATADGPHITSLAFVPFGLLSLYGFLRKGKVKNLVMSVIFSTLILLTSPFGFTIYLGMGIITTFSEMLLGRTRLRLARLGLILILSLGLASFWYNPQFIHQMVFGPLGEELRSTLSRLVPISFFAVPALAAFGFLLFDRKPDMQPAFLASFYTISFGLIVMAGGGLFPSHPSRYMSELGISISFLSGFLITKTTDYLRINGVPRFSRLNKHKSIVANLLIALLLVGMGVSIIAGKQRLEVVESDVLGLWTGVERGEIWVARDNVSTTSEVLGYVISGLTVGGLSIVATKARLDSASGKQLNSKDE